jgi:hypothetical protein
MCALCVDERFFVRILAPNFHNELEQSRYHARGTEVPSHRNSGNFLGQSQLCSMQSTCILEH